MSKINFIKTLAKSEAGFTSGMMSMGLSLFAIMSTLFILNANKTVQRAADDATLIKQNFIENNANCNDNFAGVDLGAGLLNAVNFTYNGSPINRTPGVANASLIETGRFAATGSADMLVSMNLSINTIDGITKNIPLTLAANISPANIINDCNWMGGGETATTMCRASGGEMFTSGGGGLECGIPAGTNSFSGAEIITTPNQYMSYFVGPMHLQAVVNQHRAAVAQEVNSKFMVEMEAIDAAIQASTTIDAPTKTAVGQAVQRMRTNFDNNQNLFDLLTAITAPEYPLMNGLASNYYGQRLAGTNTPIVFSSKEASGAISAFVPPTLTTSEDPTATGTSPGLFSGETSVKNIISSGAIFSPISAGSGGSLTVGSGSP